MSCAHYRLLINDGEINKMGEKYSSKIEAFFLDKRWILGTQCSNFKCLQDCPGEEEVYSFCVAPEGEVELVIDLKGPRF